MLKKLNAGSVINLIGSLRQVADSYQKRNKLSGLTNVGNFLKNRRITNYPRTLSYKLALTLDFIDDATRSTPTEGDASLLGKEIQLFVWAV
jgi:hypothetical protein